MEISTYTVQARGHTLMKTQDIVTIRLKGTAPGFGPEAKFRSDDGAGAILGALGKHPCFTCGVLEDEYGVIITEASQQLHPGTYFFTPGRRIARLIRLFNMHAIYSNAIGSRDLGTLIA